MFGKTVRIKMALAWKISAFVVILLAAQCVHGHRVKSSNRVDPTEPEKEGEVTPRDHRFFLKQIFDKYGHQGIISFEGFEHLLENLGLGRLVFEKSHNLSLHKVNGSFQEVHDSLNLHHHSHENSSSKSERRKREAKDFEIQITTYKEPMPMSSIWKSRCLTPQDILQTFGLEPHHKAAISQQVFLDLCPAIIYELDQRSCYSEADEDIVQEEMSVMPHLVWLYASISILVISLIGLVGVTMVPLVQRAFFDQLLHFLVALAVGTMCGDALFHLLPHALITDSKEYDHTTPVLRATVTFMAIGFFFLFEAVLHNIRKKSPTTSSEDHSTDTSSKEKKPLNDAEMQLEVPTRDHHHSHHHGGHEHVVQTEETVGSVAWMVIMGDGLHNLTDGLAIGVAFSGDTVAGFATAVAVLCHELPHELGDFAVLLQAGMSVKNAVAYNIISSVLSFIGMIIGVLVGEYSAASQWIYAFTAGSFLYISLVDLIPEMNKSSEKSQSFFNIILQLAGITSGAIIMFIIAVYEDTLSSLFS